MLTLGWQGCQRIWGENVLLQICPVQLCQLGEDFTSDNFTFGSIQSLAKHPDRIWNERQWYAILRVLYSKTVIPARLSLEELVKRKSGMVSNKTDGALTSWFLNLKYPRCTKAALGHWIRNYSLQCNGLVKQSSLYDLKLPISSMSYNL